MATVCSICQNDVLFYSVGQCDHHVCYVCSTRMRVLCQSSQCPICRSHQDKVIFCSEPSTFADIDTSKMAFEQKSGIYFTTAEIEHAYDRLLACCCPQNDDFLARDINQLKMHLRKQHELFYCDICFEYLKLFVSERKVYDKVGLSKHRREGDEDNRSHRGHPLCQFCDIRYFDNDELYRHLRIDHFHCQFCDSFVFYEGYPQLRKHFATEHYLCEEDECKSAKFINAFASELDFKAHKLAKHSQNLSKQERKQLTSLNVNLHYKGNSKTKRAPDEETQLDRLSAVHISEEPRLESQVDFPELINGGGTQAGLAALAASVASATYKPRVAAGWRNDEDFPSIQSVTAPGQRSLAQVRPQSTPQLAAKADSGASDLKPVGTSFAAAASGAGSSQTGLLQFSNTIAKAGLGAQKKRANKAKPISQPDPPSDDRRPFFVGRSPIPADAAASSDSAWPQLARSTPAQTTTPKSDSNELTPAAALQWTAPSSRHNREAPDQIDNAKASAALNAQRPTFAATVDQLFPNGNEWPELPSAGPAPSWKSAAAPKSTKAAHSTTKVPKGEVAVNERSLDEIVQGISTANPFQGLPVGDGEFITEDAPQKARAKQSKKHPPGFNATANMEQNFPLLSLAYPTNPPPLPSNLHMSTFANTLTDPCPLDASLENETSEKGQSSIEQLNLESAEEFPSLVGNKSSSDNVSGSMWGRAYIVDKGEGSKVAAAPPANGTPAMSVPPGFTSKRPGHVTMQPPPGFEHAGAARAQPVSMSPKEAALTDSRPAVETKSSGVSGGKSYAFHKPLSHDRRTKELNKRLKSALKDQYGSYRQCFDEMVKGKISADLFVQRCGDMLRERGGGELDQVLNEVLLVVPSIERQRQLLQARPFCFASGQQCGICGQLLPDADATEHQVAHYLDG